MLAFIFYGIWQKPAEIMSSKQFSWLPKTFAQYYGFIFQTLTRRVLDDTAGGSVEVSMDIDVPWENIFGEIFSHQGLRQKKRHRIKQQKMHFCRKMQPVTNEAPTKPVLTDTETWVLWGEEILYILFIILCIGTPIIWPGLQHQWRGVNSLPIIDLFMDDWKWCSVPGPEL